MKRTFATTVIGWFFCLAGLMMWLGWMIMPLHIGVYFEPADFAAIHEHFHLWIWMYRVHLFGYVVAAMAVVALAAVSTEPDVRVLMFPGAAVATAGLIVGALGAAFYYHHGAWGALELSQQSFQGTTERIAALRAAPSLDDDPGRSPQAHIFVESRAPWTEITDAAPQFPEALSE